MKICVIETKGANFEITNLSKPIDIHTYHKDQLTPAQDVNRDVNIYLLEDNNTMTARYV